jgi:ABC-type sugar transport system ATPase subunit
MIEVGLVKLVRRIDRVAILDMATSIELRPGELFYILGPSGSGKTTLARLIAGLDRPDDGEIFFDGKLVNDTPPEGRGVGLLFQGDPLWPHLSVADNVGLALRHQGLNKIDRRGRVAEALTMARIDSLAGRKPDALTPLQRRRAGLARALAVRPQILVFDEPTAGLDPRDADEFRDDTRRLHAELQLTTLVLTRDAREALSMAERLAVLDLGRIVQSGQPAEVYNRPVDALVGRLLGPINLFQGQVEGSESRGGVVVRTPLGRLIGHAPAGAPAAGSPVTVAIRPESLWHGGLVPQGANRFAATLERQVFLGELRALHLRGPGDWPLMALAIQAQSGGLREGQGLTLAVMPESVIIFRGRNTPTSEDAGNG